MKCFFYTWLVVLFQPPNDYKSHPISATSISHNTIIVLHEYFYKLGYDYKSHQISATFISHDTVIVLNEYFYRLGGTENNGRRKFYLIYDKRNDQKRESEGRKINNQN